MRTLFDPQGRLLSYLRLSITDVCNYRCQYCLPQGYQKPLHRPHFLTPVEIEHLVRALAGLGLWKVRITGGEPTVRPDFPEIAARIASIPGIQRVAMTTNGYRLAANAALWRKSGVSAINISMDSLDSVSFHAITGKNHQIAVLNGLEAAKIAGFAAIKVNTVLLKGINDHELSDFVDWVQDQPITLRFIELMETGNNPQYFEQHHVRSAIIQQHLHDRGWHAIDRVVGAGPAQEFQHPDHIGRVGIIAPYAKDFCQTCNRLRVTATGELRLCLFANSGHSVRHLLQSPDQCTELQQMIRDLLTHKSPAHVLHQRHTGATPHLAVMGG